MKKAFSHQNLDLLIDKGMFLLIDFADMFKTFLEVGRTFKSITGQVYIFDGEKFNKK